MAVKRTKSYRSDTPTSKSSLEQEYMPTALDFTSVYKTSPRSVPYKALDTVTGQKYSGEERNQNVVPGDKMLGVGATSLGKNPNIPDGSADGSGLGYGSEQTTRKTGLPKFKADIDFGKQNQNP